MSAESDLYDSLNVVGVTSVVSTRIYPDVLPEGCVYPAIVYARSSTDPVDSIGGVHYGDFVSFSVSAWGKTRASADAAADAIESALRVSGHQVTGREAGYDQEVGLMASTVTTVVFSV